MPKVFIKGINYIQDIIGAHEFSMEVEPNTSIETLLKELDKNVGGQLASYLFDGDSSEYMRIFLNGRDIRFLDSEKLVLADGDKLLLLPRLAGG